MKKRIQVDDLQKRIFRLRDRPVMVDSDLAEVFGVSTKALNQGIKRNKKRFPADFVFQMDRSEMEDWKSQIVTSKSSLKMGLRKAPYVFTEHGAIMAANILRSGRAMEMSVFVVRAFVQMRTMLSERQELAKELAALEQKLTQRLDAHEMAIVDVLRRVMRLLEPPPALPSPPRPKIGFQSR
jgi:phage regulator Rha-like protein